MAELPTFSALPRSRAGKGASRAVRRDGRIPGVIYGGKKPPELISLETKEIVKAYSTGKMKSRLYQVMVDGKPTRVVPRDVQLDPVFDRPLHVDLFRVEEGAKIALMIPVHFLNQPASPGIKRGGVLNIVRHEVELLVDPDHIPPFLEADLTGLEINDSIHISAIKLPEGARPTIQGRDFTVATIAPPSGMASAADTAAEGAAAEGAAAAAPAAEAKK